MPAATTPNNEAPLQDHFNRVAARLDNISNMFYLAEYANTLNSAYRNSMKQATAQETKQGLISTMTNVMEIIAIGSADRAGVSNTLSVEAQSSALKKLSATLFKHTDPALIPAAFSQKMAHIAWGIEATSQRQNHVVKAFLDEKAQIVKRIAQKAEQLKSAPQKGASSRKNTLMAKLMRPFS